MKKKDSVYESVLQGYLSMINERRTFEDRTKAGIEDEQASIDANTARMNEAVAGGDKDTFMLLSMENAKHNASIEFYKKALKSYSSENQASTDSKAEALYHMADAEINRIKSEYTAEVCEALKPIIEKSNDVLLQVELLELAKNKIRYNLEHKPEEFRIQFNYNDIGMMRGLNQMLQSPDCITEMCGKDVTDQATLSAIVCNGNKWDKPARSRFSEEASKWL